MVKLRPTEYRLLYHLVQNAGWVVTHDQILVKVWGYEYRDEPHYVRLYINYLRQKLEKDPANPVSMSARYGTFAMEILINQLLKMGGRRENMEAKVFGGGNVLRGFTVNSIGESNANFVLEYLQNEGIRVVAEDMLGVHPRKI